MRLAALIPVLSLVATAGIALSGPAARAADMPTDYPIIETPEPTPLEAAGGWYLRGDIGYKFYNDPDARVSNPTFGSINNQPNFWDESMGDSFNIGVGAGYKLSDYLRADVTLDYETPGEFSGKAYCGSAACGTGLYTNEYAHITAWSALVNGYADLGTYGSFTPYVGAGIGASYLVSDKNYSKTSTGANSGSYEGDSEWNFAWALMAGASMAINNQLSVDLGYRYLNLGDAQSGIISGGGKTTRVEYNNIDAHELRVGLRYNLN